MLYREIHPPDPQPHRHSMLVPRWCAPRVTRCCLGKNWSRDFFQQAANPAVHRLSMTHIVGGSKIWWRMHSAHSLPTTPSAIEIHCSRADICQILWVQRLSKALNARERMQSLSYDFVIHDSIPSHHVVIHFHSLPIEVAFACTSQQTSWAQSHSLRASQFSSKWTSEKLG